MDNQTASHAPKRKRRRQVSDRAQKSRKNPSESKLMYTLTNNKSGEAKEGSYDSILMEAAIKLNESVNMVQTLQKQLRSKDNKDNLSSIEHQLEHICIKLKCSICHEIFIKPTVLNCCHTFCHECIQSRSRSDNSCPKCGVDIKSMSPCIDFETFSDKITNCLPDEIKSRRESLKIERNNNRDTADRHGGNRDQDAVVCNVVLDGPPFDPIPLGDVIGRFRDVLDDDLADSS